MAVVAILRCPSAWAQTDTTPPSVALTSPVNGSRQSSLASFPTLSGTAGDDVGVTSVNLRLVRIWTTGTWSGTAWSASTVNLPTILTGTGTGGATTSATWTCSATLPSGTDLVAGQYSVQVSAFDAAGHQTNSVLSYFTLGSDTTAPSGSITSPYHNVTIAPTGAFNYNGTVKEESGGSGLWRVFGSLYRNHNGTTQYWNGTAWVSSGYFFTNATLSAPDANGVVTWSSNVASPPASEHEQGQEVFYAYLQDRSGNVSNLSIYYFITPVERVPPTITLNGPANNERLSSSGVSSASATNGQGLSSLLAGQTQDDATGSGIRLVQAQLTRSWSGVAEYWTGTAWSSTSTYLPCTLTLVDAGGAGDGDNLYNWTLPSGSPPSGSNLLPGYYTFNANAFDRYSNSAGVGRTFYINPSGGPDTTAPLLTVSSPVSESVYNPSQVPTSLSGTVRDPVGSDGTPATGVGRVDVRFCRYNGTTQYWNGTAWSATATPSLATVSAPDSNGQCTWSISGVPIPSGSNLPNERYFFFVVAYDKSINYIGFYDYIRVAPNDTTAPVCALTSIASESVVTSLPSTYGGTAGDPNNPDGSTGSGVSYVTVRLMRNWTGTAEYWNGTAWTTSPYSTNATLTPNANNDGGYTWSWNAVLPTGSNAPPGRYYVWAQSLDRFGNSFYANPVYLRLGPDDTTNPTVTITSPAAGATLSRITQALGTAVDPNNSDGSAGSGVVRVGVSLRKIVNGTTQYWNGTTFTSTNTALPGDNVSWTRTQGFPSAGALTPGTYTIYADASDRYGRYSYTSCNFSIVANTYPSAQGQTVSVIKNTAQSLTLSASDAQGDAITAYRIVTAPQHGTLSGSGANRIFTPATGYVGADSFTFAASDYGGEGAIATVTLDIYSSNHVPQATAQTLSTPEDTAKSVTLSGQDDDGEALTFQITTQPQHGTLSALDGATLTYTPALNYNGADSFSFAASDGQDTSNPAMIALSVTPVNDAPLAVADSLTTNEDTPLVIAPADLLANDSDPDGATDTAALTVEIISEPSHGTLERQQNGTFHYIPNPNWNGTDSFTYKAKDSSNAPSSAVAVNLTVAAQNDAPTAQDTYLSLEQDTTGNGTVGGDDPDGDVLTFQVVTQPTHGTLILQSSGLFTYTPEVGYSGEDEFSFRANDGTLNSTTAMVSLSIAPAVTVDADVLDASIRRLQFSEGETPFKGSGIVNGTGQNQTVHGDVYSSEAVIYEVKVENKTNDSGAVVIKAPTANEGWTVNYHDSYSWDMLPDITTAQGWRPTLGSGDSLSFCIEVVPPEGAAPPVSQDLLVQVAALANSQLADAVKAVTTLKSPIQTDASIQRWHEGDDLTSMGSDTCLGQNIYNTTGEDQSLALATTTGQTNIAMVRVQNTSSSAGSIHIQVAGPSAGWQVKLWQTTTGNGTPQDVFSSCTGATGWDSPVIAPGDYLVLKLETTATATSPAPCRLIFTCTGAQTDVVKATYVVQQIRKLQLRRPGQSWQDATDTLALTEQEMVGFRALPQFDIGEPGPDDDWPDDPAKPTWMAQGKQHLGTEIWVRFADVTNGEAISAECGNTKEVAVQVTLPTDTEIWDDDPNF